MKQRNKDTLGTFNTFNPFSGLQPMLSPGSRTLPPLKRSARNICSPSIYPSKIPIRIPNFSRKKQHERKEPYTNFELDSGIACKPLEVTLNSRQRSDRLLTKTKCLGERCLETQKLKKKNFEDENTLKDSETSILTQYRCAQHRFGRFEDSVDIPSHQSRLANKTDFRMTKSCPWANSLDVRDTQIYGTRETVNKQSKNISKDGDKIRKKHLYKQQRILGRHLHPIYKEVGGKTMETSCNKVREKRNGFINASLSAESQGIFSPVIITDSVEEQKELTLENHWLKEDRRKAKQERKAVCRITRNLKTVEEDQELERTCLRMTQFTTEEDTGIPCKPRLHKIHLSSSSAEQNGTIKLRRT